MKRILELVDTALDTIAMGYPEDAAPFVRDAQRELAARIQDCDQPMQEVKSKQGPDARWRSPVRDLATSQLRSAWNFLGAALQACCCARPDTATFRLEEVRKMLGEAVRNRAAQQAGKEERK